MSMHLTPSRDTAYTWPERHAPYIKSSLNLKTARLTAPAPGHLRAYRENRTCRVPRPSDKGLPAAERRGLGFRRVNTAQATRTPLNRGHKQALRHASETPAVKRTRTAQSVVSVRTAHVHVYTQTHMRHGGRPASRSHECPTHGTLPPGRARVAHPTVSLRPRESYAVGGHFSPLEYLRSRHALHKSRKNVPSFRVYAFTCTSP